MQNDQESLGNMIDFQCLLAPVWMRAESSNHSNEGETNNETQDQSQSRRPGWVEPQSARPCQALNAAKSSNDKGRSDTAPTGRLEPCRPWRLTCRHGRAGTSDWPLSRRRRTRIARRCQPACGVGRLTGTNQPIRAIEQRRTTCSGDSLPIRRARQRRDTRHHRVSVLRRFIQVFAGDRPICQRAPHHSRSLAPCGNSPSAQRIPSQPRP